MTSYTTVKGVTAAHHCHLLHEAGHQQCPKTASLIPKELVQNQIQETCIGCLSGHFPARAQSARKLPTRHLLSGSLPHMEHAVVADQAEHRSYSEQRARSPANMRRRHCRPACECTMQALRVVSSTENPLQIAPSSTTGLDKDGLWSTCCAWQAVEREVMSSSWPAECSISCSTAPLLAGGTSQHMLRIGGSAHPGAWSPDSPPVPVRKHTLRHLVSSLLTLIQQVPARAHAPL